MTVKQLIRILEQCNEDRTVKINAPETGTFDVSKVCMIGDECVYIEAEED